MKAWKRYHIVSGMILGWSAGAVLAGVLLGVALECAWSAEERAGMPWGAFCGFLMYVVVLAVIGGMLWLPREYSLAVSMGEPRRRFLAGLALERAIGGIVVLTGMWGLYKIEITMYSARYPGEYLAAVGAKLYRPEAAILLLLAGFAVELLMATLLLRFGSRALGIFLLLSGVLSQIPGMLSRSGRHLTAQLIGTMGAEAAAGILYVGILFLVLVCISVCIRVLGRQRVEV